MVNFDLGQWSWLCRFITALINRVLAKPFHTSYVTILPYTSEEYLRQHVSKYWNACAFSSCLISMHPGRGGSNAAHYDGDSFGQAGEW
jgi:hypothetical protein